MSTTKDCDFIKLNRIALLFSLILIVISFCSIFLKKFNFGIDFTGGVIFDLSMTDFILENDVKNALSINYENNVIQKYTDGIIIKIPKKDIQNENKDIENITQIIKSINNEIIFNKIDFVGPQVGEMLIKNGIISLLLSFVGILLYIWSRFKLHFGTSAVVALLHNVILLFGFISISQLNFDLTTIAAILTVVGYSVNDTVVLFDRIRENLKTYKNENIGKIINISINNNLKRTLYTSISTLLAISPLLFSTVSGLKSFSVIVSIGIIIGTYSSIFIASSMLMYNYKLIGVKKNEKN